MNTKLFFYPVIFCCLAVYEVKAQTSLSKTDSTIVGVWNGTSICQIKNSPCHDEIVVYRISKAQGTDEFSVSASKIIDGKEDEMGILSFRFDERTSQLSSSDHGLWKFDVKGKVMDGTLVYNGSLYRIVKLSKQD